MAMINLFKVPRSQLPPPKAIFTTDAGGLKVGLPALQPFVTAAPAGTGTGKTGFGLQVPVLAGSF
jgi:hypothetical protein